MTAYFVRRVVLLVLTMYIVATALFLFVRFLPGNAVDLILNTNNASYQGNRAKLEHDLGLDKPVLTQYVEWLEDITRGNFGRSLTTRLEVGRPVLTRTLVSAALGGEAIVFVLLLGVPVGILSAIKRNSLTDYALRGATVLGLAVPAFWLGLMAVVLPSKYFQWTPAGLFVPFSKDPGKALMALIIPAVILGIPSAAVLMRYVRTQMLEVISQDYVRTARAKGLRAITIVLRHSLPNALTPVLTIVGIQVPILVSGAVVIERVFSIPGLGSYILTAVQNRDYPAIEAANLVVALIVLLSNLLVDIMYVIVDPRLRTY